MNKEFFKDIEKAYATYQSLLVRDIMRVPMSYPNDVCRPTKITISDRKKDSTVTFSVEKFGVVGKVELANTEEKDNWQIVDISPASVLRVEEALDLLRRQKNGVIYIKQELGVELCTRGMPFHTDVVKAVEDTTTPSISINALRKLLSYVLGSTDLSPKLLYLLLTKMENEASDAWEKPMAQYTEKGSLLGDSPIKTDKTIRAMRFGATVGIAEKQDIVYKLSGKSDVCLKDFLPENLKDCEAAEKFRLKSGTAKINCYQTMLTEALKIHKAVYSHHTYR